MEGGVRVRGTPGVEGGGKGEGYSRDGMEGWGKDEGYFKDGVRG